MMGILQAIIVSSETFGIGHLLNLFNGSGMNLANKLIQISFAIAAAHHTAPNQSNSY